MSAQNKRCAEEENGGDAKRFNEYQENAHIVIKNIAKTRCASVRERECTKYYLSVVDSLNESDRHMLELTYSLLKEILAIKKATKITTLDSFMASIIADNDQFFTISIDGEKPVEAKYYTFGAHKDGTYYFVFMKYDANIVIVNKKDFEQGKVVITY